MNLPPLSIPDIPLPFAVSEMMHPAIVHFAVALPVIIILLELINLAVRRKVLGSVSFVLMILMVIVYFGAYLTGSVDADKAKDLLSPEAKTLLETHKNGGIWMVYGSVFVLLLKLISVAVKKIPARVVFLVVLGLFFWGTTGVVQRGCALTYKHGVNVHKDVVVAVPANEQTAQEPVKQKETVEQSAEKAKAAAGEMVQQVEKSASETAEKVKEKASEAIETLKAKTAESVEKVKNKASEAVEKALEPVEETPQQGPAHPVTPVETVPAG